MHRRRILRTIFPSKLIVGTLYHLSCLRHGKGHRFLGIMLSIVHTLFADRTLNYRSNKIKKEVFGLYGKLRTLCERYSSSWGAWRYPPECNFNLQRGVSKHALHGSWGKHIVYGCRMLARYLILFSDNTGSTGRSFITFKSIVAAHHDWT